ERRELSQGASRLGRRDGSRLGRRDAHTPAGRIRRGSLSAESAPAAHGARRDALPRMSTTDSRGEQALAERVVGAMIARDAFSRWLGITLLEVRPRYAAVRMTVRDDMVNGFGVSHGGIAYSVADSALAFASNTNGRVTVSIENAITYPAPVRVGDVITAIAE